MAKAKKEQKGGKRAHPPGAPDTIPRLSGHPRAKSQIALAKSWAGLIVFAVVTLLSHGADLPWFDSLLRGLGAGIVAYLVAWAAAVVIWQNLAKAELEVMRKRHEERLRAEREGHDDPVGPA